MALFELGRLGEARTAFAAHTYSEKVSRPSEPAPAEGYLGGLDEEEG